MKPLLARIAAGEVLIGDGAMGTWLMERGLEPGLAPESLNLSRPELLTEIAGLYTEAGSDIVVTNSFGATSLKLAAHGLDDQFEEINRAAVAAAREGVGGRAYVSGDVGPTGRLLKPYGDVAPEEVYASYETQARVLAEAGVDVFSVETMTDLTEAVLAVKAIKAVAPGLPVLATMTFDETPRGFYTIMGNDLASAVAGLADAGADIVGSNCGNGSEQMLAIAGELRRHTELPLIIQPNAGLPRPEGERVVYPETPAFMAEMAVAMVDAGVSVVGACCGSTPEHIRAIREAVLATR